MHHAADCVWAVGWPSCQEQRIWESVHNSTALLFDMHNELVHCPAEICKLHQRCFRWLSV